ncbi:zinc ribbon domain-containing protein [Egicoccus sp. AB-alg6-2]|uniref:zinc ribbon domain-containing protein n=1 Tax=Egicoccus sp. AB-alg6-2 TaxID=3242692 RepID=UPI00359D0C8F
MADPSPDDLERLLELQATDHRIRKVQHILDDLPEQQQLVAANERVAELRREHEDLRVELERANSEQRQLERETDVLIERRDAERVRLYDGSVTNARELKSVEAEVDATVRRIEEHEDAMLAVMERLDELESRSRELLAAADTERQHVTELEVALDESAKEWLAELAELQAIRDRQAAAIPEPLLTRYQEAAVRGGGTGIGQLDGNACTACRIEMSYADVGELFEGPPLTTCPQCRRLLVVGQ